MNNIKQLREAHHQTAAELGKAIGRSQPTISKWENRRKLKYEEAKLIADYYNIPVCEVTGEAPENYIDLSSGAANMASLPIIDASLSAGSLAEGLIGRQLISMDLIKNITQTAPGNITIVRLHGDAMSPTINENDFVWIDTSITHAQNNGLYLFKAGSQIFVKRLCFNEFTASADIISDNPLYPPVPIKDPEKVQILGKVISIHKFLP